MYITIIPEASLQGEGDSNIQVSKYVYAMHSSVIKVLCITSIYCGVSYCVTLYNKMFTVVRKQS